MRLVKLPLTLLAFLAGTALAQAADAARPNILFIFTDDKYYILAVEPEIAE